MSAFRGQHISHADEPNNKSQEDGAGVSKHSVHMQGIHELILSEDASEQVLHEIDHHRQPIVEAGASTHRLRKILGALRGEATKAAEAEAEDVFV
mmetsp:Transcript_51480/g.105768  ORF Transcript_51480/g.105768 Transcript_51480/m.105768 type:complete len:95 (-) Transcript_51480:420-704(-)